VQRRRAIVGVFDQTLARADTPAAEVAAISELLRRAARRKDPEADRYEGDRWRAHLDAGAREPLFRGPAGAVLLDGAFRRDVDPAPSPICANAHSRRYLEWMR
jgi:hypothetical protein